MINEGSPKDALVVFEKKIIYDVVNDLRDDKNALVKRITFSEAANYLRPIFAFTSQELDIEVYRQVIEVFGTRKGGLRVLQAYLESCKDCTNRAEAVRAMLEHASAIEGWEYQGEDRNRMHKCSILYYNKLGDFPSNDELEFMIEKIPKKNWEKLLDHTKEDGSDVYTTASCYHLYKFNNHNDSDDAVQEENDSQILEGAIDKIDQFIDLIDVA